VGEGSTATPGPDDRTRIGSLTKTMTATILLQLVQEGSLALDDLVADHLDPTVLAGLPNADTATLLDLARMTSGMEPYTASADFRAALFGDPARVWTPGELLSYVSSTATFTPPGSGWEYSNTNYILLGLVIEQIDQKPLAQVFEDRLFGPLGMTDTTFPEPTTNTMADPHLRGVTEQGQPDGTTGDATDWNPSEAWSAGGVVSTLADIEKWANALFTGEGVLDQAGTTARSPATPPACSTTTTPTPPSSCWPTATPPLRVRVLPERSPRPCARRSADHLGLVSVRCNGGRRRRVDRQVSTVIERGLEHVNEPVLDGLGGPAAAVEEVRAHLWAHQRPDRVDLLLGRLVAEHQRSAGGHERPSVVVVALEALASDRIARRSLPQRPQDGDRAVVDLHRVSNTRPDPLMAAALPEQGEIGTLGHCDLVVVADDGHVDHVHQ
jgi:hypothetical protein